MQSGLSSNNVNNIFIDNLNRTWVATDGGVYLYVSGNLFNFEPQNNIEILKCTDICQDANNNLWFTSYGNGLYKFENGSLQLFNETDGLISSKINKIYVKDHLIYIGTDNGLSIYNITTKSFSSPKINQFKKYINFSIVDFIEIENELYFITLNDGFFKIINQNKIDPRIIKIRNHNHVTSLFLWNDKIYEGNINSINVYRVKDYITNGKFYDKIPIGNIKQFITSNNQLIAISESLYDNDGGLYRINDDNIYTELVINNDEISKSFTSVAINKLMKKAYIGTRDNGFLVFDIDNSKIIFNTVNTTVNSIISYNEKLVFLYNDRIEIKDLDNKLLHEISYKDIKSKLQNDLKFQRIQFLDIKRKDKNFYVQSNIGTFILSDDLNTFKKVSDNNYPITFFNNELYDFSQHYSQKKTESFIGSLYTENPNQLPHLLQQALVFGDKIIVSSKNNGLYLIENGKVISLAHNKLFNQTNINFIQKSMNNKLLVITDFDGVFELDPNQKFKILYHITACDLIGKKIFYVDNYDPYYVIGTEAGVEFISPKEHKLLNTTYGLPQFNYSSGEIVGNNIYIGGLGGYYKFDIENFLSYNNEVTSVSINSIHSKNKKNKINLLTSNTVQVTVNESDAPLIINFMPFTKYDVNSHKIRYKINPDAEWSHFSKETSVQLLDLPANSYQIELEFYDEITQKRQKIHLVDIKVKHNIWPNVILTLIVISICALIFFVYKVTNKKALQRFKESNNNHSNNVAEKEWNDTNEIALEMKMLLNSLNSHFIFNIINYLQYTILQNENKEALRYNECFSKFFRSLLTNATKPTVCIENEIEFITSYVDLERSRFSYEIDFSIKVDDNVDVHGIEIPTFILHPILETLLNYSFYDEKVDKAQIILKIKDIDEEKIEISYVYNGYSIEEIEKNENLRFNKSLHLLLDCLHTYNNDNLTGFLYGKNENGDNIISFILYV